MKTLVLWRIMEGKSTSWCIFQTFHNDSMTFRSGDWEAVWCCLVFINCSWNFHPEIWNWKEKTASVPHCAPDPHIFYLYITIPIFFLKRNPLNTQHERFKTVHQTLFLFFFGQGLIFNSPYTAVLITPSYAPDHEYKGVGWQLQCLQHSAAGLFRVMLTTVSLA